MKKKNFKHTKNNTKSFYSILLFSFLTILVTSMLLLSIFLISILGSSISSSTKNYNQQLLAQTNYTINQLDESINRLRLSLQNNKYISAYLSLRDTDNTTPVLASQEVLKQLLVLPTVDSIYLYNANLDLLYSSKNGFQSSPDECEDQEIISNLNNVDFILSYDGSPIAYKRNPDTGSAEIFTYYIFDATEASDKYNAIVINVKASTLTNSILTMKSFTDERESNFVLSNENDDYVTSVLNLDSKDQAAFITSLSQKVTDIDAYNSSYINVDGTVYFLTHTDENVYGWHLFNLIPVSALFHDVFTNILLSLAIILLVFIFTWMICRYLAKHLYKPVEILTDHVNGAVSDDVLQQDLPFKSNEFQLILSTVTSLRNNNEHLRSIQQKTKYSSLQSYLNELVTTHYADLPELVEERLKYFGLSYLKTEKLCMALFKIDNYHTFLSHHTPDEIWSIRFATVNIIEELVSVKYTCNAISHGDDKFVLILSCNNETDLIDFEDQLVLLLQSIQNNIEKYLHITVSTTYSNVFQGIKNLFITYKQMENSILLKIRLGHRAIIEPHLIDEIQTEPFLIPSKTKNQLIDSLICGNLNNTMSIYENMIQNLFYCNYAEIHSVLLYLIHGIYERLSEKYPMLKDTFMNAMRKFISNLEFAEIAEDIFLLSQNYFETICNVVQETKRNPQQQNSVVTAERIVKIMQENYSDSSLCLASIADEIGLSSNYTGQIFKQYTKKSISQYLLEIRMEKIAYYLQTSDLPLNKILELVGLEKNNYFYTRFKNYFGMSLNEYKLQFQTNPREDS